MLLNESKRDELAGLAEEIRLIIDDIQMDLYGVNPNSKDLYQEIRSIEEVLLMMRRAIERRCKE